MKRFILLFLWLFSITAYCQDVTLKTISVDKQLEAELYSYHVFVGITNTGDSILPYRDKYIILSKDGWTKNIVVDTLVYDNKNDFAAILIMRFTTDSKYLLFSSRKYNFAYEIATGDITSTPQDFNAQLMKVNGDTIMFVGTVDKRKWGDGIYLDEKKVKKFVTLKNIYRISN